MTQNLRVFSSLWKLHLLLNSLTRSFFCHSKFVHLKMQFLEYAVIFLCILMCIQPWLLRTAWLCAQSSICYNWSRSGLCVHSLQHEIQQIEHFTFMDMKHQDSLRSKTPGLWWSQNLTANGFCENSSWSLEILCVCVVFLCTTFL